MRTNLLYREFTRVRGGKVPDAKTLGRLAQAMGPEVVAALQERVVTIAHQEKVVAGRKMRVDTTVVETNIHYPTDSSLLGDGVRVLTRLMKRVTAIAGPTGTTLRDRTRSVKYRMLEIGRASRTRGEPAQGETAGAVPAAPGHDGPGGRAGQAVRARVDDGGETQCRREGAGRAGRPEAGAGSHAPAGPAGERQARARVLGGDTQVEGKLVSLFEPTTEIIRKGKASKPTEFGKLVKIQEAEQQIIVAYEVYAQRPSDRALLVPAIEVHQQRLGRVPEVVAADAGFYSSAAETTAQGYGSQTGVGAEPGHQESPATAGAEDTLVQTGPEMADGLRRARISLLKRRHGLTRCRYKGDAGMQRWVGLGVIGDNLINLGTALARATRPS